MDAKHTLLPNFVNIFDQKALDLLDRVGHYTLLDIKKIPIPILGFNS